MSKVQIAGARLAKMQIFTVRRGGSTRPLLAPHNPALRT